MITQPTAGEFKAFSSICTHAACPVADVTDTINCNCHGSKFSITDGSVVNGPAVTPLPARTVTVSATRCRSPDPQPSKVDDRPLPRSAAKDAEPGENDARRPMIRVGRRDGGMRVSTTLVRSCGRRGAPDQRSTTCTRCGATEVPARTDPAQPLRGVFLGTPVSVAGAVALDALVDR